MSTPMIRTLGLPQTSFTKRQKAGGAAEAVS